MATELPGQTVVPDVERGRPGVPDGGHLVAECVGSLLEGGHHHNAAGEAQGIFDEGFVIVNKEMKKAFLDSAAAIGKITANPTAAGLSAEWEKVKATWGRVSKGGK